MRFFVVIGILLLLGAQYTYWFGDSGHFAVQKLEVEVLKQSELNARLQARNQALSAEVVALQTGLDAVEARARTDLGMIADGESFYVVVDPPRN